MGLLSGHFSCAQNLHSMHCIHISLDELIEYASRQYRHKVSLEPSLFMSLAFFDFVIFLGASFANFSLETFHTLLFPILLCQFLSFAPRRALQFFFKAFLLGISQNGSCSLLLVYILTLSETSFRKRSNVLSERRMCFFL